MKKKPKKKPSIKLIVADIEGCLTVGKKLPINTGELTKIHAYCEMARIGNKPPLVLCTGRPQPYAEAIIQTLDAFFPGYPSIVENGCFLYDPVEDVLISNPAIIGKEKDLRAIGAFLEETIVAKNIAKIEPGKELCISLNTVTGETIEKLYSRVMECLSEEMHELVFITHSASAVDVTPKGVDKASGLAFLSERTGIPFEEMLGIGDTRGDFPMLERVGIPTCPGNAKPEVIELVRRRNGYVAEQPNTAGAWEILLHFGLIS